MEIWEEIEAGFKHDIEVLENEIADIKRHTAKNIEEAKSNEILQAIGLLSTAVKSLVAKVNDIETKLAEDD